MNSTVYALSVGPDGTLYAGGSFTRAGDAAASYIAMWQDGSWQALGSGMDHNVMALAPAPDGRLYAAGGFTTAGGKTAHQVALWNGTEWEALGGGIHPPFDARPVWVLALDPRGRLYAGGNFDAAGDLSSPYLSRWDGRRWSPMGEGVDGGVHAMAIGADGSLYIGGYFTRAGNVSARHVARWKDGRWSALEGGTDNLVHALSVGQGGMLHVGGSFAAVDVIPASGLACWQISTSTSREHIDMPQRTYDRSTRVYPNPFSTVTHVSFVADGARDITLKVFDVLGRERVRVDRDIAAPGRHEIVLDASHLPSGTYHYVLDTGVTVHTGSAVVLRR
ncbi:MAG: T9SS type A sorting domain-containing protein [Rhodothermales bacterium]